MRFTNKHGLPQAIYKAVTSDPYSKGEADFSITELLQPARVRELQRRHHNELEEDIGDRIWALYGQAMHAILEQSHDGIGDAEIRLFADVSGVRVSGQLDRFSNGTITDFKFVTLRKFRGGRCPEEYEKQLNCYAALARLNGRQVEKLEIIALLRDWHKAEWWAAQRENRYYPKTHFLTLCVPLWSEEKALRYLEGRVEAHKGARGSLPKCLIADRWFNRQGVPLRCEAYCNVSKFCSQYQEEKKS